MEKDLLMKTGGIFCCLIVWHLAGLLITNDLLQEIYCEARLNEKGISGVHENEISSIFFKVVFGREVSNMNC